MTDHLTAIIDAATCKRPVECMRGHSDWCRAARKVAVRDAVREALGSDRARDSYASFWWAQETGETDRWEDLDSEEREAVIENSYAETVTDWLTTEALGGAS